jgi:hypothetical protein
MEWLRAIPGGQGAERKRGDGTLNRRGLSQKVREKLTTPNERRLAVEVLTRRVRPFTQGVIFGSRGMTERWFEANRRIVQGRSRTERKRGAKSPGQPSLQGLDTFRDVFRELRKGRGGYPGHGIPKDLIFATRPLHRPGWRA